MKHKAGVHQSEVAIFGAWSLRNPGLELSKLTCNTLLHLRLLQLILHKDVLVTDVFGAGVAPVWLAEAILAVLNVFIDPGIIRFIASSNSCIHPSHTTSYSRYIMYKHPIWNWLYQNVLHNFVRSMSTVYRINTNVKSICNYNAKNQHIQGTLIIFKYISRGQIIDVPGYATIIFSNQQILK